MHSNYSLLTFLDCCTLKVHFELIESEIIIIEKIIIKIEILNE